MNAIRRYLAAVPGSFRGFVSRAELARAIGASNAGSLALALLVAVLSAVSADAAAIFPDPKVAYLAALVAGLVLDLTRRLGHGTPPPPA